MPCIFPYAERAPPSLDSSHQTNPMAPWDPLDALSTPWDPLANEFANYVRNMMQNHIDRIGVTFHHCAF